jgi:hypothetical protein
MMHPCCPAAICLYYPQDAVNTVSSQFSSHSAQLFWRKWAMMHGNANVIVDLFWWLAATFFCKARISNISFPHSLLVLKMITGV